MARAFRILKRALFVLVGLIVTAVAGLYGASEWMLRTRYDVRPQSIVLPTDPASLERGRHLTEHVMHCAGCHGDDLGGKLFFDAGPLVARIPAPNLTSGRGGIGTRYTDADWVRAVRHGVRPDGRPLVVMPSDGFSRLPASDLAAVIAYVKSRPAVDRDLAAKTIGPIGRVMLLSDPTHVLTATAIDHSKPVPEVVPSDVIAKGEHLANISGCTSCHGPDLTGAPTRRPAPRTSRGSGSTDGAKPISSARCARAVRRTTASSRRPCRPRTAR